jgi:hypothetical protein
MEIELPKFAHEDTHVNTNLWEDNEKQIPNRILRHIYISGWHWEDCPQTGSWMWYNKEHNFTILATPNWEGNEYSLPITITDHGELDHNYDVPWRPRFTLEDYIQTIETIIKTVCELLKGKGQAGALH